MGPSLLWLSSLNLPFQSPSYWLYPNAPGDRPRVTVLPGENKLYLFVEDAKLICVSLILSAVCAPRFVCIAG